MIVDWASEWLQNYHKTNSGNKEVVSERRDMSLIALYSRSIIYYKVQRMVILTVFCEKNSS